MHGASRCHVNGSSRAGNRQGHYCHDLQISWNFDSREKISCCARRVEGQYLIKLQPVGWHSEEDWQRFLLTCKLPQSPTQCQRARRPSDHAVWLRADRSRTSTSQVTCSTSPSLLLIADTPAGGQKALSPCSTCLQTDDALSSGSEVRLSITPIGDVPVEPHHSTSQQVPAPGVRFRQPGQSPHQRSCKRYTIKV